MYRFNNHLFSSVVPVDNHFSYRQWDDCSLTACGRCCLAYGRWAGQIGGLSI